MSFVAEDLIEWWLIHTAILEIPDDEAVDTDNQPIGGYLDPVVITNCRLHDASTQQIIDAQNAGIPIVNAVLLTPPTLHVPNRSKISGIKRRSDNRVVEPRALEVVGETTGRSDTDDEIRMLLLKRVG